MAAYKNAPSRTGKLIRLILGAFDPRAWVHAVRLVNHYNQTHVRPLRRLTIGPNPAISPNAQFSNPERIRIGANFRLGSRGVLWAGPAEGRIVIGDDVMFGPDVLVTAAGYRYDDGRPVTDQAMDEADVVIGDDVWIGAKSVILPGARIGEGAIIGAAAVVRGEIPPFSVAVGAPARVVGARRRHGGRP
jgi:acetyltransferase-like isoleucine patch superfamily enzyme